MDREGTAGIPHVRFCTPNRFPGDGCAPLPSPSAQEYATAIRELSRVGWACLRREFREVINRWEGRP